MLLGFLRGWLVLMGGGWLGRFGGERRYRMGFF
jgi:hypothetical protein